MHGDGGVLAVLAVVAVVSAFAGSRTHEDLSEAAQMTQTVKVPEFCSILVEEEISCEKFVKDYVGKQPVILRGQENLGSFAAKTAKDNLVENFGQLPLKLSTANSFTGRRWVEMDLKTYIKVELSKTNKNNTMGNETLYLFGSQRGDLWDNFLEDYSRPTLTFPSETFLGDSGSFSKKLACMKESLAKKQNDFTSLSFGIAGIGSGVPFHFHGPGFLQMIHGRKRWFFYPPGDQWRPEHDPNATTLHWLENVYPNLEHKPSHECTLLAGDIIYFPNEWLHATLNLDEYTVFVATFA